MPWTANVVTLAGIGQACKCVRYGTRRVRKEVAPPWPIR
jgi:hypothetical protein